MQEKDSFGGSIADEGLDAGPHEAAAEAPAVAWSPLSLPLGAWLDMPKRAAPSSCQESLPTAPDHQLVECVPDNSAVEPLGHVEPDVDIPPPPPLSTDQPAGPVTLLLDESVSTSLTSLPADTEVEPAPALIEEPTQPSPPVAEARPLPDASAPSAPKVPATPQPPPARFTDPLPAPAARMVEGAVRRLEVPPAPMISLRDIAERSRSSAPPAGIALDPELLRPFEPAEPASSLATPEPAPSESIWKGRLRTAARIAKKVLIGYAAVVTALILLYRFVDPPFSTLMAFQRLLGRDVRQVWVPLEQISPALVRSVIASEDGRFCYHWGIDPGAIREAIERAKGGLPRGASTISMQVAKNMFLWPSKSYIRKAIEVPVTLVMELVWPKRRILEIYLNVAEWGPGVFGAEAAAQHHFRKSAAQLSSREAALLAATLPNPIRRDAGDPGPATSRKASVVQGRARAEAGAADCVLSTLRAPAAQPAKGTGAAPGL